MQAMISRQRQTRAQAGGGILRRKKVQAASKDAFVYPKVTVDYGFVNRRDVVVGLGHNPAVADGCEVPIGLTDTFTQCDVVTVDEYEKTSASRVMNPQFTNNRGRREYLIAQGYTESELHAAKEDVLQAKVDRKVSNQQPQCSIALLYAQVSKYKANEDEGASVEYMSAAWANAKWKSTGASVRCNPLRRSRRRDWKDGPARLRD